MTVTAVVTSHNNKYCLDRMIGILKNQSVPPDEILVYASGYTQPVEAIIVEDKKDAGHDKRAMGLQQSSCDLVGFFNDDDFYHPQYIEKMVGAIGNHDLVYCNFVSHLFGNMQVTSVPRVGAITSGNFLVKTKKAKEVGYNHRHYQADGQFIEDLINNNATHTKVNDILYVHL